MREYGIKRKKSGALGDSAKYRLNEPKWSDAEISDEEGSNSSANTSFDPNTNRLGGHDQHTSSSVLQQDLSTIPKQSVPEGFKDPKYFERRRRNNMAAKKSRDARKNREDQVIARVSYLEQENAILRAQVTMLREEANILQVYLLQKKQSELSGNPLPDQSGSTFSPPAPTSITAFPPDFMNLQLPLPLPFALPLPLQQLSQLHLQLPVNFPFGHSMNIPSAQTPNTSIPADASLPMLMSFLNQCNKQK